MSRAPKAGNFVIASMQVDPPTDETRYALLDRSWTVPRSIRVTFQLNPPQFIVRLTITIEGGRPVVRQLEVKPGWLLEDGTVSGGVEGVTTTNLRQLLVDRLVRATIESVRRPVEMAGEETRLRMLRSGMTAEEADFLTSLSFRIPGVTPDGRVEFDPNADRIAPPRQTVVDRVARAAELYREFIAAGSKAPVKDVGTALGYSTSQASRYLSKARELGLLEEDEEVPGQTGGER